MAAEVLQPLVSANKDTQEQASWLYGASVGFIPWNVVTLPFQFAVFVVIVFILVFLLDFSWGTSIVLGYLTQAVLFTYLMKIGFNFTLKILPLI